MTNSRYATPLTWFIFVLGLLGATPLFAAEQDRPNVLLICVDDLRPELGCYGCEHIKSPNIDRLAREGRRFTRHYVEVAVCGPSRCTLLTGTRVHLSWDVWGPARKLAREPERPVSFAHLFRRAGYRTVSIGKVSHEPGGTMPPDYETHQVPFSWDVAVGPGGAWKTPWAAFFGYAGGSAYNAVIRWVKDQPPRMPFEGADVPDHGYPDALNADLAIEHLNDLAKRGGPFLLAVGFFKPHLPHNAPKKYWDLYPPEVVGMAAFGRPPENVDPAISLHNSFEPTTHYHWPSGPGVFSRDEAVRQRRAYFACVSYTDAQIGRVLDEYRRLGLQQNTIVVLWADHGWHLGDYGIFGKATNFEVATRSPLIVKLPDMPQPGQPADGLAETVDVYPTLADLCGLEPPEGLAGTSLRPMLEDPSHPGKDAARSFFRRGQLDGNALRTDRFRLVEWRNRKTGKVAQIELYDHQTDPGETRNVAAEQPEVVEELLARLHGPTGHKRG